MQIGTRLVHYLALSIPTTTRQMSMQVQQETERKTSVLTARATEFRPRSNGVTMPLSLSRSSSHRRHESSNGPLSSTMHQIVFTLEDRVNAADARLKQLEFQMQDMERRINDRFIDIKNALQAQRMIAITKELKAKMKGCNIK